MTGPGDRSGADPEVGAYAPSGGFRKGSFGVTGSGDTSGFGGLVRVEPGGAVALHGAALGGDPNSRSRSVAYPRGPRPRRPWHTP